MRSRPCPQGTTGSLGDPTLKRATSRCNTCRVLTDVRRGFNGVRSGHRDPPGTGSSQKLLAVEGGGVAEGSHPGLVSWVWDQ